MVFVCIILFVFWKVFRKTKFVPAATCDLVWERPIIDAYEASIETPPALWEEFAGMCGMRRRKNRKASVADSRRGSVLTAAFRG